MNYTTDFIKGELVEVLDIDESVPEIRRVWRAVVVGSISKKNVAFLTPLDQAFDSKHQIYLENIDNIVKLNLEG
jgi:hypothetical protein